MIFGEEFEIEILVCSKQSDVPVYARIGKNHDVNRLYEGMIISTTGYMRLSTYNPEIMISKPVMRNDIILYRYAEVLLNYAEAKAELGTLTQTDWNRVSK